MPLLTSSPSPTSQESQHYFSLSSPLSAWEQREDEHGAPTSAFACLLPSRASPDSNSTRLLGTSAGFPFSRAPGYNSALIPGDLTPSVCVQGREAGPSAGPGQRPGSSFVSALPFASFAVESQRSREPFLTLRWQNSLRSVDHSRYTDTPCSFGKLG